LALARRWSLTPRQAQVLELLAAGRSNKLVAVLLHCAERTIEMHVTALFGRVQAASRAELVARFWTEDV
jgi:DNA-binding CsgD family transcriptional regulator